MSKKEKDRLELAEMFMCKADKHRCFFGIIRRWKDSKGKPNVFSKIVMTDGFLWAQAADQRILGSNLDEICIMRLSMGLHNDAGVTTNIFGLKYFLN